MKKITYVVIAIIAISIIGLVAYIFLAPKSPKDLVTYSGNGLELKVEYSRPYK